MRRMCVFVEVVINGEYEGVYVLTELITAGKTVQGLICRLTLRIIPTPVTF